MAVLDDARRWVKDRFVADEHITMTPKAAIRQLETALPDLSPGRAAAQHRPPAVLRQLLLSSLLSGAKKSSLRADSGEWVGRVLSPTQSYRTFPYHLVLSVGSPYDGA